MADKRDKVSRRELLRRIEELERRVAEAEARPIQPINIPTCAPTYPRPWWIDNGTGTGDFPWPLSGTVC